MEQMNKKIKILLLLLSFGSLAFAQNPAIFKGGTADGWVSKNYTQGSANIFKGGNADGWSAQNYNQNSSNIFKGGTADGWAVRNYTQGGGNIFKGGTADGYASLNFQQSSVSIYKGGNGDGWDTKNRVQSSTLIFKGGTGDGWASSYLPQQPLPVVFVYFTAQKQGNNAALVQWKTGSEVNTAYFDVERSADAVNFEYIGKVLATGNTAGMSYSFTDNHPLKGVNYYRLKQADKDNKVTYTPARQLRFDVLDAGIVKYYPNPTSGILNIEITQAMQSEAIVINVSNASGMVLNQVKVGAGSSSVLQVPLNRYAKGVYFIQVKTTTVSSTQRVVLQ